MSDLPEKLYYSIREVAEHTGVEAHVLRYWESEFPTLKPKRSRSGSRTYRRRDIDEILVIKRLLHDDGYRIEGARKMLRNSHGRGPAAKRDASQLAIDFQTLDSSEQLKAVRRELRDIQVLLRGMRNDAGD